MGCKKNFVPILGPMLGSGEVLEWILLFYGHIVVKDERSDG
jgi:hypothetical protein